MTQKTRRTLMAVGAVIVTVFAMGWAYAQIRSAKPDPSVDNGVHSSLPGPPPEAARAMRKMIDARRASGQPMPTPPTNGEPFDPERAREAMAKVLSPEEQEAMREGMQRMMKQRQKVRAALGPEETRAFEGKMRDRIRQMMARDGGIPPNAPPAPPAGE